MLSVGWSRQGHEFYDIDMMTYTILVVGLAYHYCSSAFAAGILYVFGAWAYIIDISLIVS